MSTAHTAGQREYKRAKIDTQRERSKPGIAGQFSLERGPAMCPIRARQLLSVPVLDAHVLQLLEQARLAQGLVEPHAALVVGEVDVGHEPLEPGTLHQPGAVVRPCDGYYHARTMAVRELSSLLCHDRMPSDVFQPDIFLINRKLIYTAKMGWPVMRVAALRKYTADVAAITPKEDQT